MGETGQHDDGMGLLLLVMALAGGCFLLAHFYGWVLADAMLGLARILFLPAAPVSPHYALVCERLAAADPRVIGLEAAFEALGIASRPYAWGLAVPAILYLVKKGWTLSVADAYRRSLSMEGLLKNNIRANPCIAPAVNWPGGILGESLDKGPWKAGRQPVQLAAENSLLVDRDGTPVPACELLGPDHVANPDSPWLSGETALHLDRERAAEVFRSQMGRRWQGFRSLTGYRRKLACSFALQAADQKARAQALLDAMSLSFRAEPEAGNNDAPAGPLRCTLNATLSPGDEAAFARALRLPRVCQAVAPHREWEDLVLLALYEAARTKGVLPTAEFIWLRPLDRRLYYLLNNVGRRTVWPEIAGPWAHYEKESVLAARVPGLAGLAEPDVTEAVNALEAALYEEGWIAPRWLSETLTERRSRLGME